MPDYKGSKIYDPDGFAKLRPFGPFIDPHKFEMQPTTVRSLVVASVVFGVAMLFAILAVFIGIQQTKASRNPWRSVYIWMIWIELVACVAIALECMLYLTYVIRPSFYFYMSMLFLWAIQIQLLLQIIINRIRIILLDRKRGRILVIIVAVFITLLNISVFCIWVPARLQINRRFIHINNIWDRTEKALYLLVDGALNFYFIRVVKKNLIINGLQKYNRLVRFNERIIIVSLLMDVMIIGAMSIPNGFVYAIFHPLAFLVKLNIEMIMANLIRRIALEDSNLQNAFLATFASNSSDSLQLSSPTSQKSLRSLISPFFNSDHHSVWWGKSPSQEEGITKTEEFSVMSRRLSQLSAHLFGVAKVQTEQKENTLAMEDMSLSSGCTEEKRRGSGAASDAAQSYTIGDDIGLIPPPATLKKHSDR